MSGTKIVPGSVSWFTTYLGCRFYFDTARFSSRVQICRVQMGHWQKKVICKDCRQSLKNIDLFFLFFKIFFSMIQIRSLIWCVRPRALGTMENISEFTLIAEISAYGIPWSCSKIWSYCENKYWRTTSYHSWW